MISFRRAVFHGAIIAAVAAFAGFPNAHADEAPIVARTFGAGRLSCADFLATPDAIFQGSIWTLGYWTALNITNQTNHKVGETAQIDDIVAAVKKTCADKPSIRLYEGIGEVYTRFLQEGK